MNELKILKDFNPADDLRQEAIKWIQDRIINYVRFKTIWTKEQCEYLEEDFKFWMDRFNISEDDLK
jgi:hypothetical protein